MIKRIIAAVAALVLAGVGIMLVISYADRADERALNDQETVDVLVAAGPIVTGTPAAEAGPGLEVRQIPRAYVMQGAVDSMDDLQDRVAGLEILPEQQITDVMFVPANELRQQGTFVLPEEAQDLHQLTIDIANPRALGGSIAAGDRVGIFFTTTATPTGWSVDSQGALSWDGNRAATGNGARGEGGDGGEEPEEDVDEITFTDLLLDKVLVVRVEGGHVADPGEGGGEASDTIHVTLALGPQDAARVIFARESSSLWLTLAPEDADDAEVRAVVPALPSRVTGAIE